MADQNPNLSEIMEALEAERLKVQLLKTDISIYKQVVRNLTGVIAALTSNVDLTVTDNPEIIAAALSTWRDTLQILKETHERDKASGWDELIA